MAIGTDPLVVAGNNYDRIADGNYFRQTATPDEPERFLLFATPSRNPGANSTYKVRWERYKNVIVGGVAQPEDDGLIITLDIKTRARSFTDVDVFTGIIACTNFFTNATTGQANVTKFLRGNR